MLGVIVNTLAVIAGSTAGLAFRRGLPQKYRDAIMTALGICTLFIGFQGALDGENILVAIISMALGTAVGTLLDIDGKIGKLGRAVEAKFPAAGKDGKTPVAQGFVTAFLLWCVGAMTIVGSIQSGVAHDNTMIFTKSVLDLISSAMLASSLGAGVLFASALLFVWQGGLVLLSGLIEPVLTAAMINEITCVGSLAIIALGLNIIGVTKIKVADFLPAIVFAPLVSALLSLIPM